MQIVFLGHPVFYADAPGEKGLKGEGAILFNGKNDGYQIPPKSFFANFSVAVDAEGKDPFFGDIYEVRCSSFGTGGFNPDADFLIDYKKKKTDDQKRSSDRKNLVRNIELPAEEKIIVKAGKSVNYKLKK